MRRLVLGLAFALVSVPKLANAEPERVDGPFTLAQAIARVQAVGFDVRVARGDADIASAEAQSARASLRPQIGISANALDANEPQLGMPVARQAFGAVSMSVPLLTASGRLSAVASATRAEAARTSVDSVANDAVFATVQAYRRAQVGEAVLEARHVTVREQQVHLRLDELKVASGKSPRYILARDRASLAVALQNEEDAASERDQSRNDLAALLDLNVDSQLAVEPLAQLSFVESREDAEARALHRRPSLIAATQRVAAAELSLRAARSAYTPTLQFSAQTYNGTSVPNLGRSGGQVQVTATVPLLDGGTRSAEASRAYGELARTTALRDQIKLSVRRDVVNAYRELLAAQRNLSTARAGQIDAEEQLRIARLRESVGKGTELELLTALSVAASAREMVARSVARYDVAIAAIHHAAGDQTI
ncbi:MAG: TolC family protein [Candidatus Eremiobacteraeota bacterium]|nr:TolC family protein [Candidatus Eremiobacteraeota bacterium]